MESAGEDFGSCISKPAVGAQHWAAAVYTELAHRPTGTARRETSPGHTEGQPQVQGPADPCFYWATFVWQELGFTATRPS